MIEDILLKQRLMAEGQRYIIRRIEPKTRNMLAETYAPTLAEANDTANHGLSSCLYEIRDLFTNKLYHRQWGTRSTT